MNRNARHGRAAGAQRRSQGRWLVIAPLLVLFSFTVQIDKTNISVVIADPAFLRALGLIGKPAHIGLLNTFFVAGYGVGMLAWGFLIDRIGPRRSAMIGVCGWGLFTLACAWATSTTELYAARALLGAAEGCLWPLSNSYIGRWFPASERSRITGLWVSGAFTAMATGVPIVTSILLSGGWRSVFISLGAFSFALLPLFYRFGTDDPARARFANAQEIEYIRYNGSPKVSASRITEPTLCQSLCNTRVALLVVCHASSSAILWGLTTWLPTYLVRERGLSLASMSGVVSVSYAAPILALLGVGYLADKSRQRTRLGAACALATMLVLTAAVSVPWLILTAFLMVLTIAAPMIYGGLHSAILHDYVPPAQIARSTGIVVGLGNILGALSPAAMGYLVGMFGGKFLAAFIMIIGLNALSLAIYVALSFMKRSQPHSGPGEVTMIEARSRS